MIIIRNELPWVIGGSLAAFALAIADAPLALRVPAGLCAVFLLPGYSLTAALFPTSDDLSSTERWATSFGFSIAVFVVLALVLNLTPWRLTPLPMLISVTAWTVLLSGAALLRRRLLGRDALPWLSLSRDFWRTSSAQLRALYLGLGMALLLAATAFVVVLTMPPPPFTEFYVLGPEGFAENYPKTVRPGEEITLMVGITNREQVAMGYRVVATVDSKPLATVGAMALEPDQTLEQPLRFSLPEAGPDQEVLIQLLRDGIESPYRTLRLWINVTTSTG